MKRNLKKCTHFILVLAIILTQVLLITTSAYADTANLAQGKTITANNYTQTYVATNANDGNVNTYWEGSSFPSTLTVDLGSSQTVYKVILKLNPSTAWATRTQTLSVLTSTDNTNYATTVGSTTYTFNPASSNIVTITFANTTARYVRLNITANSGATGGQVAEFEVYGPGSGGGTPDLIVTDISWSPASPQTGNAVTFSATIKNQGTGATPAGTINGVSFFVDGTQVSWSDNNTSSIAAGASVVVTACGGPSGSATWTATTGTHTIMAWVDDVNRIAESNESNNQYSESLTVSSGPTPTPTPTPTVGPTPTPGPTYTPTPTPVPGTYGATMPYTRYESENGSYGGGATLKSAPTFDLTQIAAQASNQKYVALPSNGSYVQWTSTTAGAGVTMRFTMPDKSDGMGNTGSLDCYVNGTKVSTINLSSYSNWQYFAIGSDQPQDAPNGGRAMFAFDEVHWILPTALKSGDTIKIQKNNGDGFEYGVDFIEVEAVPAAIGQPANSLSVTAYGAVANDSGDDLAAFNSCVSAAVSQGKSVYIPAGTFNLNSMWVIGSASARLSGITISGAGMWHTNIMFTNANSAQGGISLRVSGKLDFSNMYLNSKLRSRYNQNAIYKCFMDDFGTNSVIHDIWEEHFECGMWVADYATTPVFVTNGLTVSNSRIRNNLADGINFCQGTSGSKVTNCDVRNNGDDGLAMWPDQTMGAPMETNNSFTYDTVEFNWRAGGIAIFGGSGHTVSNCYVKDGVMGSAFRMNTVFPGYHFDTNTGITVSNCYFTGTGTSHDCYNGERGAIDLEASNSAIKNVTFSNIQIINTQRDAIQMGYGGGFSGINFNTITINGTGKDGETTSRFSQAHLGAAFYTYTGNGSAAFTNTTVSNIAYPSKYLVLSGFNVTGLP